MKKIMVPGVLGGIAALIGSIAIGFVINGMFPTLAREYENPALFRPWSDPLMMLFFLSPFILGLAVAFVWDKTKEKFSGLYRVRTAQFTLLYWIIVNLPGMFISYTTFPISFVMVATWSISALVQIWLVTLVVAKMNA